MAIQGEVSRGERGGEDELGRVQVDFQKLVDSISLCEVVFEAVENVFFFLVTGFGVRALWFCRDAGLTGALASIELLTEEMAAPCSESVTKGMARSSRCIV